MSTPINPHPYSRAASAAELVPVNGSITTHGPYTKHVRIPKEKAYCTHLVVGGPPEHLDDLPQSGKSLLFATERAPSLFFEALSAFLTGGLTLV
jgi:hypothetical protein